MNQPSVPLFSVSALRQHPERRPGEVLFANMRRSSVAQVGWSTKRTGAQACFPDGSSYQDNEYVPVFVQLAELLRAGVPVEGAAIARH